MNATNTNAVGWTSLVLEDSDRKKLLQLHGAKHKKVILHHITMAYKIPKPEKEFILSSLAVVGYASNDVIDAFVAEVNGDIRREDGKIYHITISLDSSKAKASDSNNLLESGYNQISKIQLSKNSKFVFTPLI